MQVYTIESSRYTFHLKSPIRLVLSTYRQGTARIAFKLTSERYCPFIHNGVLKNVLNVRPYDDELNVLSDEKSVFPIIYKTEAKCTRNEFQNRSTRHDICFALGRIRFVVEVSQKLRLVNFFKNPGCESTIVPLDAPLGA